MKRNLQVTMILVLLFSTLIFVSPVLAATSKVSQTGQTQCFDALGRGIDCVGTGQDGESRAGVAWPNPRFSDNNDMTITDNLTGLMWTKDTLSPGPAECLPSTNKSQIDALKYVKCLNSNTYLGHSDWRLPNLNDLRSLFNYGISDSRMWMAGYGFQKIAYRTGYFISSTPGLATDMYGMTYGVSPFEPFNVWPVRTSKIVLGTPFRTGSVVCVDYVMGSSTPCAGTGQDGETLAGLPWPNIRFVDNGTGVILDQLTGLSWMKDASTPTYGECIGGVKTWQEALDYVKCLNNNNYSGHNDWRMPNVNEQSSLANRGVNDTPAWLNTQGFANAQTQMYWTSTNNFGAPANYAWGANLWGLTHWWGYKTNKYYVLPVRSDITINQPPLLNSIGSKTIDAGFDLSFIIQASDPDGNALSYSASNLPAGAIFDSTTHTFSWTPTSNQAGNYPNVLFTVTDNGTPKASAYEAITITVNNVNRPPVLNAIGNKTVNEGDTLSFVVSGSDPDGNALAYSASNLPAGATFDPATQTFSWTPLFGQAGNYNAVLFTVTDNGAPIANFLEAITITVNNVNRPPVMSPIGNKTVSEGQAIAFTLTAIDPDGDEIAYTAANLPAGATFDPIAQTFIWTPTFDQSGEFANIEFTVTDNGSPIELATQLITITVNNTNRSPVFAPVGSQQTLEGKTVQFLVLASDPDGNAITYSASSLPQGAIFDANHNFLWTPNYTQAGNYTVTFYATDNGAPNMLAQMDVSIAVDVPAPSDIVNNIINTITGMRLPKNLENSYMANLKKVNIFIAGNKFTPAINELDAFIGKVNNDILDEKIGAVDGNNLIAMANAVISILQP